MIAVIDSGGANITSVISAFERMDVHPVFTCDADVIRSAEKVILPGVGAAGDAMKKLEEYGLVETIRKLTQPVMGICLGMQLLYETSEEGNAVTIGAVDGQVRKFDTKPNMPVPHMGWNKVKKTKNHPLLTGVADGSYFYFVHSYYAPINDFTVGSCSYANDVTAIVAKGNFMGCQFHPERSGPVGQQIIRNFVELDAGDLIC